MSPIDEPCLRSSPADPGRPCLGVRRHRRRQPTPSAVWSSTTPRSTISGGRRRRRRRRRLSIPIGERHHRLRRGRRPRVLVLAGSGRDGSFVPVRRLGVGGSRCSTTLLVSSGDCVSSSSASGARLIEVDPRQHTRQFFEVCDGLVEQLFQAHRHARAHKLTQPVGVTAGPRQSGGTRRSRGRSGSAHANEEEASSTVGSDARRRSTYLERARGCDFQQGIRRAVKVVVPDIVAIRTSTPARSML